VSSYRGLRDIVDLKPNRGAVEIKVVHARPVFNEYAFELAYMQKFGKVFSMWREFSNCLLRGRCNVLSAVCPIEMWDVRAMTRRVKFQRLVDLLQDHDHLKIRMKGAETLRI
jgi:hypothetical protein